MKTEEALEPVVQKLDSKFWRHRNVLVTGASGFLGGWLIQALIKLKANTVALARDRVGQSDFFRLGIHEKITVVWGKLEDYHLLERVLNEGDIQTVIHIGAQTQVTMANRNPLSTFESNIKGTWNLMEACRRSPHVKEIVLASSDKAYGDVEDLPYSEETPTNPFYPYDVSKGCAEMIARCYAKSFGLNVGVTRCGNFYGGGDLNFHRLIPGTIRSVLDGQPPLIRSNGHLIRDYFHVFDAAYAYLLLAQKMSGGKLRGQCFNFSNEDPRSALDITKMILKVSGKNGLKPKILNQATNEIEKQYLSASKARKELGWKPLLNLQSGLSDTYRWYANYFKTL